MNLPGHVEQREVVVVGAGPAGLSAALAAAEAGAALTLIDAYRQPGGQYYRLPSPELQGAAFGPHQGHGRELWEKVRAAGVTHWAETVVWGAFPERLLGLHGAQAPDFVQAKALILATGTYERPVAFPGWTLPGVMTAGAAQTLIKEQGILPGKRFVLVGAGPLQLVLASELIRYGAEVVAVCEGSPLWRRALRHPLRHLMALRDQGDRLQEGLESWLTLRRAGAPVRTGWGIVSAQGDEGVESVTLAQLDNDWRPIPGTYEMLSCDTLCVGYGFVPATELCQLSGAQLGWIPEMGGFVPLRDETMQTTAPGVYAVGDGAGVGGAQLAMIEGRIAGLAAVAKMTSDKNLTQLLAPLLPSLRRERRFQQLYADLFTPGPGLDELAQDDTVLCRCEELTRGQLRDLVHRGADALHAVKAISRCGMGNCQGRICGPLMADLVARETRQNRAKVGYLRSRPPIFPVPIVAFKAMQEET